MKIVLKSNWFSFITLPIDTIPVRVNGASTVTVDIHVYLINFTPSLVLILLGRNWADP